MAGNCRPEGGLIRVSPDGRGFVDDTGAPFVPWGLNYDRSFDRGVDVILEDLLRYRPEKLDDDFRIARALGANAIRIFPMLSHYIPRLGDIDETAFARLDVAIETARANDLRVDLTGLALIDGNALPPWLATATDEEAVSAEALFWSTVAARYRDDPAIFCYDLQNEPIIRWDDGGLEPVGCLSTEAGRTFCYVHPHLRDVTGAWVSWVQACYPDSKSLADRWTDFPRDGESWEHPAIPASGEGSGDARLRDFYAFRENQAANWTRRMVEAIREHDPDRLITIGLLPAAVAAHERVSTWGAFTPRAVAPYLDYISIHMYPHRIGNGISALLDNLWEHEFGLLLCQQGKPVVVEEWFAYGEGVWEAGIGWGEWFDGFMEMSRPLVAGWFSFYHQLIDDGPNLTNVPGYDEWIDRYRATASDPRAGIAPRTAADATLTLDRFDLFTSREAREEAHDAFRHLRTAGKTVQIEWRNKEH